MATSSSARHSPRIAPDSSGVNAGARQDFDKTTGAPLRSDADRLAAWRLACGLTLRQLAADLGISKTALVRYESGARTIPPTVRDALARMTPPLVLGEQPPAPPHPPPVSERVLLIRARRRVLGTPRVGGVIDHPSQLRRVSAEYDRLRAEAGLPALVVNEPPPGWTPEEDRREELLAWSEHVALRKVA